MNTTFGFPPADALVAQIISIDYKKHAEQFVTLFLTVLAVSQVLLQFVYNKAAQWYHSGGKEQLLDYAHRAILFINNRTGAFDKLYALLIRFYNLVEIAAHKVDDVTQVKVAQ